MSTGYRALAALLFMLALFGTGYWQGSKHVQRKWDADKMAVAEAQAAAIMERVANNQLLIDKQAADRATITKDHNEELATVRADAAKRLRRGKAICSGPSSQSTAQDAGSGNAADTGGGFFPESTDRDLRALMLRMEEVAATGRACQAGAIANGMQP